MWNLKKKTSIDKLIFKAEIEADVENKLWISNGVRLGRMNWEVGIDVHILLMLCMWVRAQLLSCVRLFVTL